MIISRYAKKMTISDIEEQPKELHECEMSSIPISRITNTITDEVITWQDSPLQDLYLIVWTDG